MQRAGGRRGARDGAAHKERIEKFINRDSTDSGGRGAPKGRFVLRAPLLPD